MPLLDLGLVKHALEIDHDEDDTYLNKLITNVEGKFQGYTERRIIAPRENQDSIVEVFDGGGMNLIVKSFPIDPDSVSIQDLKKEEAVDTKDFTVYPEKGVIKRGSFERLRGDTLFGRQLTWPAGMRRWEVTYKGGINLSVDWEYAIRPELESSFLDVVLDWYENRNPDATSERSGSGFGTSFDNLPIPNRTKLVWEAYRPELF